MITSHKLYKLHHVPFSQTMELYLQKCWLFSSFPNAFFRSVLNWANLFSCAELIESFSVQHLHVEANPQMSIRKTALHGTLRVLLNHQAVFIIRYLFEFVFEVLCLVHWEDSLGVFGHFLLHPITLFWKSSWLCCSKWWCLPKLEAWLPSITRKMFGSEDTDLS